MATRVGARGGREQADKPRKTWPEILTKEEAASPLAYSVPMAAKELSVSARHLRMLIAQGKVPIVKLGERIVIRRATLETLLAELEQRSTAR